MARGKHWAVYLSGLQPQPVTRKKEYVGAMSIQVYVQGKSKAEINRRLAAGETIVGTEHKLGSETKWPLSEMLPDGSIIKVFSKVVGGSPYAKSYGRWNQKLRRVV